MFNNILLQQKHREGRRLSRRKRVKRKETQVFMFVPVERILCIPLSYSHTLSLSFFLPTNLPSCCVTLHHFIPLGSLFLHTFVAGMTCLNLYPHDCLPRTRFSSRVMRADFFFRCTSSGHCFLCEGTGTPAMAAASLMIRRSCMD